MSAVSTDPAQTLDETDGRVGFSAWYIVGFLTIAASLSTIDRQALALMIGPIKRDLGITDSQMGLLGGLAFTLLYSVATLPAAWLADKKSRRLVVTGGMAFWSLMTMACGMTHRFGTLFLARMGVGVGEAALSPAAYSMLSDLFPKRKLPLAIGLLTAAPFIGVGFANIIGGRLVQYLESIPPIVLPILGAVKSWQVTFLLLGIPGVLLAILGCLTIAEPQRQGRLADGPAPLTSAQILTFLKGRRRFLALHFTAYIALSIQGWCLFFWVIEFLVRQRGMDRASAGLDYGVMALVLGMSGSVISGQLAAKLLARRAGDTTLRLVFFSVLALMPLAVAMPLVPHAWQTLALLAPITFLMGWPGGLGTTALQLIVPNELRGRIIALYMLVVNCVSLTLGPYLGGLISDQVFDGKSLGGSLSLMACVDYPLAAICLFACLGPFRRALEQARAWDVSPQRSDGAPE